MIILGISHQKKSDLKAIFWKRNILIKDSELFESLHHSFTALLNILNLKSRVHVPIVVALLPLGRWARESSRMTHLL